MVRVTRRDFLKYCAVSAGALGLSASTLMRLENVLAKTDNGAPAVVWIAGAACTGCTMSLTNEVFYTTIDNILLDQIDLKFIDTLQAAAGSYVNGVQSSVANSLAAAQAVFGGTDPFVLVVEGAIPTATPPGSTNAGDYCRIGSLTTPYGPETMLQNVNAFASNPHCVAILSVGTCSSFGGVPGALGNVTGAKGVAFTGTKMGGAVIGNGNNSVQDVSVKANGHGYNALNVLAGPSVSFNGGCGGSGAVASPVMALGVTSISITNHPVLTLRPNVVIDKPLGATDKQATAMAVLSDGVSTRFGTPPAPAGTLMSIDVTYEGTGYLATSPPLVKVYDISNPAILPPGTDITASIVPVAVASGYVSDFTVTNGGTGYTCAPAVELSGGLGTGAEAAAVMDFGGITDSVKFRTGLATKLVNISGCPPHPDWIVGTLAYILDYLPAVLQGNATVAQMIPSLNRNYQPIDFGYATYQCNAGPCPWRYNNTDQVGTTGRTQEALATNYRYPVPGNSQALGVNKWQGDDLGCLGILGCKGRKTKADCSARRWNADGAEQFGVNWCVGSRGGCHGCTEPTFPDKVGKFFTFA